MAEGSASFKKKEPDFGRALSEVKMEKVSNPDEKRTRLLTEEFPGLNAKFQQQKQSLGGRN